MPQNSSKTISYMQISGEIEVNEFSQIRLIVETKCGDDS